MSSEVWNSKRLIYRAPEESDDNEFYYKASHDSQTFTQAAPFLPVPQAKKGSKGWREWMESCLLGVIICLPAPVPPSTSNGVTSAAGAEVSKPIPIGTITLMGGTETRHAHHRCVQVGISITAPYQGQGYGSEAILWALNWGFVYANLHRIEIGAFEWNPRAIKLYERLGFKMESRKRENMWFKGRYWDTVELGMLKREWEEMYGNKEDQQIDVVVGQNK